MSMLYETDAGGMIKIKLPIQTDTPLAVLYKQRPTLDRVLVTKFTSRLKYFYQLYTAECKQHGRAPIAKILRTMDEHIREETVMAKFDGSECDLSSADLSPLVAAMERTYFTLPLNLSRWMTIFRGKLLISALITFSRIQRKKRFGRQKWNL